MIEVKICGLRTEAGLEAALGAGADYVGLVFFPPSPRNVAPDEARALAARARGRAKVVALMVDPDEAQIARVVAAAAPDLIQLHGLETCERVCEIRRQWGIPVMKAVGIESGADVERALAYAGTADRILFDAQAPADSTRPGGNGSPFDWTMLAAVNGKVAYVLSGGLTPGNVAAAIRATGATAVDVSSGVEIRPGEKDPRLIRSFIRAAKGV